MKCYVSLQALISLASNDPVSYRASTARSLNDLLGKHRNTFAALLISKFISADKLQCAHCKATLYTSGDPDLHEMPHDAMARVAQLPDRESQQLLVCVSVCQTLANICMLTILCV